MTNKPSPAEKISFRERSHAFKIKVVREIENGLISRNFAAKKYLASRSSIEYWCKKLGTDMNEQNNHSTKKEIKKLKSHIEDLEFVNMVQKEALDAIFKKFGEEAKKSYAKQLADFAKELQNRK